MHYKDLKDFGFLNGDNEYIIFDNKEKNLSFIKKVPNESGVYIIFANREIQRLKGKSNIIYIGKSEALRDRLKDLFMYLLPYGAYDYFRPHTARTAMMKILKETNLKLTISYIKKSNPREFESRLIVKYCNSHIEPPPLNNQRR
ncbi:MAG: hypothetical protein V1768_02430 [Patescibacteria group bacterium]